MGRVLSEVLWELFEKDVRVGAAFVAVLLIALVVVGRLLRRSQASKVHRG